jgi:glycosyltransferase involved in cell wall biosynthesis
MRPTIASYNHAFLALSETFIYRLLTGLQADHDVIVMAREQANRDAYPFEPVFTPSRSEAEFFAGRVRRKLGGGFVIPLPSANRYFEAITLERGVSLIHAQFGYGGMEILPVAQKLKIPLVVTFLGHDASTLLANVRYRRGLKQLFAYAEVITVSQEMADRLIQHGANPARTHFINLPVPLEEFAAPARELPADKIARGETVKLLQVSRLQEKKGHVYALRALAKIAPEFPGVRYVIGGDGPLRATLGAEVAALGLADRVQFSGAVPREQVAGLMADADIYLHPSVTASDGDREGLPTSILEAMACALPTVATFHAGIPEAITHGESGYLAAERDVDGLADALRAALTDRAPVGLRAREVIEREFSLTRAIERHSALYARLLSERGAGR